jgi:predicted dehydrogenase
MRVAVVGLGVMGATHVRAWQRIPEAELAAIVSSKPVTESILIGGNLSSGNDPSRTVSSNEEPLDLSGVQRLPSLQAALSDSSIHAIDLCIPTHLHADATIAALDAGKHVLVEKPMALNDEACARMMTAARGANRLLMVGHVLRFWSEYQPLIQAAHSETLGRIQSLDLRRNCAAPGWSAWLADPAKSGGGAFDLLIHDVDLCIYLLGMPQAVSAMGNSNFLNAALIYDDLTCATISGGWHTEPSFPFSMDYSASFEKATLEFASAGKPVLRCRKNGEVESLAGHAMDAFEAELAYFAGCVRSGRAAERCRMDDSARAVKLMRLILQSQSGHGKMFECNP